MPNRIPSLQSLLILDAAVKHGNFTRAAEAMSLTHGAVSQQVKRIENLLGVRLFIREGQGMRPTGACLALVGEVRQAIALLDRAFTAPPRRVAHRRLTISVLPHFATGWLIPRLPRFETPERRIAIDLVGSHLIDGTGRHGIDASVRFGPGNWPSVIAEKLSSEVAFPVCAPSYLKNLLSLDAMNCAALLRSPFPPWEPWLQAAGIRLPAEPDGRYFSDPSLLLIAVREGHGIGMARRLIVADDLRQGRLVRPFDIEVEDPYGYYLVWRPDSPRTRQIREFCEWLKAEIAETEDKLS
jgi:DNA-binding transcriptional LysR family regulator